MATEAQPGATPPRRRPALASVSDVRRETARVYRAGLNGELPLKDMTRLVFVLVALSRMLETQVLEQRIGVLEQQAVQPALEHNLGSITDL